MMMETSSSSSAPTTSAQPEPPDPTLPPPPSPSTFIRFRFSHADIIQAKEPHPYDTDRSPFYQNKETLRGVPIIRIFGATDRGQRVMANVRGAFPYVYVEYKGPLDPDSVSTHLLRLGKSLNKAMPLSFSRSPSSDPNKKPQYVAYIVLCKGTPFYGYHVGYKTYLKIYVINPKYTKRLSEVLRSGAVMRTKFDVFEDHIPFMLQFMLDTNLYGCGWVEVGKRCHFREPLPDPTPSLSEEYDPERCDGPFSSRLYTTTTVPPSFVQDSSYPKSSYCTLELDLPVSSILNSHSVTPRNIHQDFIEKLYPESIERKQLVLSVRELWDDERRRKVARGEAGPSEMKDLTPREIDQRDLKEDPLWFSEGEMRKKLEGMSKEDLRKFLERGGGCGGGGKGKGKGKERKGPEFESYVKGKYEKEGVRFGYLERVKTTFEQVDAAYPVRWEEEERQEEYLYGVWAVRGIGMELGRAQEHQGGKGKGKEREMSVDVKVEVDEETLWRATQQQRFEGEEDEEGQEQGGEKRAERRRIWESPVREDDEDGQVRDEEEDAKDREDTVVSIEEGEEAREGTTEEEDKDDLGIPENDCQFSERPSKRQRRDSSDPTTVNGADSPARRSSPSKSPAAYIPRSKSNTPAAGPAYAPRNTFSSPHKASRYMVAKPTVLTSPTPPPPFQQSVFNMASSGEEDDDGERRPIESPPSNSPPSPPPARVKREEVELEDIEGLQSDAFDDWIPTPTQYAPGASTLPDELRSVLPIKRSESSPSVEYDFSADLDMEVESTPSGGTSEWKVEPKEEQEEVTVSPSPTLAVFPPREEEDPPPPPIKQEEQKALNRKVAFEMPSDSDPTTSTQSRSGRVADPSPGTKSSGESVESYETRIRRALNPNEPIAPNCYAWLTPPPTAQELTSTMEAHKRSQVVYKDPFYSDPKDVPRKAREYAGRKFVIKGDKIAYLQPFKHSDMISKKVDQRATVRITLGRKWEWAELPPSWKAARAWLENDTLIDHISSTQARRQHAMDAPHIEGPTQPNQGFKFVSSKGADAMREKQHLSLLTMELHVNTRGNLLPDPKKDRIEALFYCLASDNDDLVANGRVPNRRVGVIAIGGDKLRAQLGPTNYFVEMVETERELLELVIEKVRYEWDPEILGGFEVHHGSWGYLLERAQEEYDWRLVEELGRVMRQDTGKFGTKVTDRWGSTESSTLNFSGRHTVNIWRILRADNNLIRYDFEHVAFHILRQRTPHFSFETLTKWYTSETPPLVARVFQYWRNRVEMDLELLDAAEFISRNAEEARVFGIDFKSVRTRGSQFKVEAMMFRISKPENFLLLSPNREQVGKQNAAECQPLIMEPKSAYYKGPLVVLDFTSLYPSIMIAYNLCYSTCLGRVGTYLGTNKLGTTNYKPSMGSLDLLKDYINITPNGFMFVRPEIRKSLLAKMLSELLDTRVMVKSAMKDAQSDVELTKMLNGRQLALKYLANVTYGYTSATFSGRMPCVEVADAIVQTARETLERAIETIRTTKEWGAEVVYGDTDSLFVYLPGKSKEDAFRIGHAMAAKVTSQNPRPVRLKFEKVYLPCVLLAKKRYVGFKYERESDQEPEFDAKGIETVRRDGVPALQKMMETCIRILFRTSDLSLVKSYCQRQWRKLQQNQVSPQEFTYAKEVRLGTYSDKIPPPPGAAVANRRFITDPRGEPEYGDRIPYLLIQSEPGTLQVNKALAPEHFVADPNLRLDTQHYIKKVLIPPLTRVFNLLGADVESWYNVMPKQNRLVTQKVDSTAKKVYLDSHFVSDRCDVCEGANGKDGLCEKCRSHPSEVAFHLMNRTRQVQHRQQAAHAICASCSDTPARVAIACDSIDCPLFYERAQISTELQKIERWEELAARLAF